MLVVLMEMEFSFEYVFTLLNIAVLLKTELILDLILNSTSCDLTKNEIEFDTISTLVFNSTGCDFSKIGT